MSLINDALKRAKAAQPPTPPAQTELHLRPAEPDTKIRHGIGYAVPIVFLGLALLVLFFVWRYSQQNPSPAPAPTDSTLSKADQSGNQRPSSPLNDGVRVRAREQELVAAPEAKTTTAPVESKPIPAPASAPAVSADSASSSAQTNSVVVAPGTSTNAVVPVTPAPVAPPPLKLQGVIYNPRRPSAVVSGKVLFIGDRFGNSRVTAITRESVTLIGGGKTNVLTLEE